MLFSKTRFILFTKHRSGTIKSAAEILGEESPLKWEGE